MRARVSADASVPSYILPTGECSDTFFLDLAGRRFAIEGIPDGWQEMLPLRLLEFREEPASVSNRTIRIELSAAEHLRPPSEPHDLNETTHLHFSQNEVRLESDWCEGKFNIHPDTPVKLLVHVEASPWFGGVLENLLRVLVAYDVLERGGVMLHCAAIVRDNRVAVLFGHSGAGKSTTSALALESGCSVISDDINIIEPVGNGWQVTPVPFSGTLNAVSDIVKPVPLHGLFRLHQAGEDRTEPCSRARGVSLLMGSSPFINQDSHRSMQLVDIVSKLSVQPGVHDLHFTPSNKFLQYVF